VAWCILIVGLAGFLFTAALRDTTPTIAATRTPMGGARTAELKAGSYTLYVVDAGGGASADDFHVDASIRAPGRDSLPLRRYEDGLEFTTKGGTAYAYRTVRVPADGVYEVSADGDADAVVLGWGDQIGRRVWLIIASVVLLVLGIAVGILAGFLVQRANESD
jgi:hypothetical protein